MPEKRIVDKGLGGLLTKLPENSIETIVFFKQPPTTTYCKTYPIALEIRPAAAERSRAETDPQPSRIAAKVPLLMVGETAIRSCEAKLPRNN